MADITASAITLGTDSTGSATTLVVTKSFTVGNVADVWLTFPSARTISSIVSSPAETWVSLGEVTDTTNGQKCARYAATITGGGSTTITVTLDSAASFRAIATVEVSNTSGYDSAAAAQNSAFQNNPGGATDAVTSGATPTLTSQPALISGWSMNTSGNGSPPAPAVGTGFTDGGTTETAFAGVALVRFEYKRVTSTTGQAATFTGQAGTRAYCTHVAAFLETGGGGGGSRPVKMAGVWGGYAGVGGGFAGD